MRGPIAALMFDGAKALGAVALAYATTPATAAEQTPVTVPTYTHMQGISPVCHKKPAGESLTPAGELLRAWLASNLHTQTNDCLLNRLSQLPDVQQKLQQLYGAGSPFLAHDLAHYGEHLLEILHSDELMQAAREVHQRLPRLPFSAQEIVLLQLTLTDPETAAQLLDTVNASPEVEITPENSTIVTASLAWYIMKNISMQGVLAKVDNPQQQAEIRHAQKMHIGLIADRQQLGLMYTTPQPGWRAEAMWIKASEYQEKIHSTRTRSFVQALAADGYTMQDIIGSDPVVVFNREVSRLRATTISDVQQRWKELRAIAPFHLVTVAGIIGNEEIFPAAIQDIRDLQAVRHTMFPKMADNEWQEHMTYVVGNVALNIHDSTDITRYENLAQDFGLRPKTEQPQSITEPDEEEDGTQSLTRRLARELSETRFTPGQHKLLKHPNLNVHDHRGTDWSNIVVEYGDADLKRMLDFLDQIHAYDPKKVINLETLDTYFLDRHGRQFDAMLGQTMAWSQEYASDLAALLGRGGNLPPHIWGSILRGHHFGVMTTQASSDKPDTTKMSTLLDRTQNEANFTPGQRTNYLKLLSLLDLENFSNSEPITLLGASQEAKALFTDGFLKYLTDFKKQTGETRIQFTDIGFHFWLTTQPKLRTTYLGMGRSTLEQRIKVQLAQHRHLTRTVVDSVSQKQLATDLSALSMANLIKIDLLLQGLHNQKHIEELLTGMHDDYVDTTREYGGLLQLGMPGTISMQYSAALGNFDGEFRMTPEMRVNIAMNNGFAAHFHAVQNTGDTPVRIAKMPYYSGPSGMTVDYGLYGYPAGGDMHIANQNKITSIVFTLLDPDRFKADIFLPGNKTLDLGIYARHAE